MNVILGELLTPSPIAPLQPSSNSNPALCSAATSITRNQPLGSTWANSGNVNIDLDNLLLSKPKTAPSLSMNQLASNPTSPVNQPRSNANNAAFSSPNAPGFSQQGNQQFFAKFQ
ncbi:hypothetical protein D910_06439 [Dendroctonus ponderosae]